MTPLLARSTHSGTPCHTLTYFIIGLCLFCPRFPFPDVHIAWAGGAERGAVWPFPRQLRPRAPCSASPPSLLVWAAGVAAVATGTNGLVWAWLFSCWERSCTLCCQSCPARSFCWLEYIHSFFLKSVYFLFYLKLRL